MTDPVGNPLPVAAVAGEDSSSPAAPPKPDAPVPMCSGDWSIYSGWLWTGFPVETSRTFGVHCS